MAVGIVGCGGMGGRQAARRRVQESGQYKHPHRHVLNFGNHDVDEVDDGYLQCLLNHFLDSSPWRKAAPDEEDVHTLLTELKNCSMKRDLQWGEKIHMKAVERQKISNIYVATAVIRMYCKCGKMADARRLFDSLQNPDVVCWTTLLSGYAQNGEGNATLEVFSMMKACRCAPDFVTYIALLKACTSLLRTRGRYECLKWGREIHSEIGFDLNITLQNTLIDMYAKCGSMVDARYVFDSMQKPNLVSWTTLLMGYADNGEGLTAVELFFKMKACGCVTDSVAYVAALKACTSLTDNPNCSRECLKWGRHIHSEIGCNLDIFVQNTLIDMYAKCGSMAEARRVFDIILIPEVVSWNALILGYVENGDELAALELFSKMKSCGCVPDSVTYIAAVKACSSLARKSDAGGQDKCLKWGRDIHSEMGCELNIFVQSTLIDMYANCGSIVDARRVFDGIQNPNVVSWTALLLGYLKNGEGLATLDLFSKMKAYGCAPNSVTYVAALKACGMIGALTRGRQIHLEITEFTAQVLTCIVDFYAKCGSIIEAHEVFDSHWRVRDTSSWTALLTGYGSFGDTVTVFNLFRVMQDEGFQPDAVTFVCLLSCCSHAGLVEKAWEYFDAMTMQYGICPTLMHYNCMVDILGRANKVNEAMVVVRSMPCNADAVTWMIVLGACRKWKNVEVGLCAYESLVDMDKKNAAAYVIMAHIYASMGMWEEQRMVLQASMKHGVSQLCGQAYLYDEMDVVGEEVQTD